MHTDVNKGSQIIRRGLQTSLKQQETANFVFCVFRRTFINNKTNVGVAGGANTDTAYDNHELINEI